MNVLKTYQTSKISSNGVKDAGEMLFCETRSCDFSPEFFETHAPTLNSRLAGEYAFHRRFRSCRTEPEFGFEHSRMLSGFMSDNNSDPVTHKHTQHVRGSRFCLVGARSLFAYFSPPGIRPGRVGSLQVLGNKGNQRLSEVRHAPCLRKCTMLRTPSPRRR